MQAFGLDSFNSWVVSIACCAIFFLQYGMNRVSGLLFVSTMDTYGVGREGASLPFTLGMTTRYISGPLSGYLARRVGMRFVILLGSVLCALGVGCCFFATSVLAVTVLWGGFYGVGCGLATSVLPQLINLHFNKHYSKAYGISIAGSSLAGFILPPIVEILLHKFELSGTFLILSGLILNCFPAAILLRKPHFGTKCKRFGKLHSSVSEQSETEEKISQNIPQIMEDATHHDFCVDMLGETDSGLDQEMSLTTSFNASENEDGSVPLNLEVDVFKASDSNSAELSLKENSKEQSVTHDGYCKYYSISSSNFETVRLISDKNSLSSTITGQPNIMPTNIVHPENFETTMKTSTQNVSTESLCLRPNHIQSSKCSVAHTNHPSVSRQTTQAPSSKLSSNFSKLFSDFNIFWDPVFLFITIAESISTLLIIVIPTVIVDYSRDKGIPVSDATYLMMSFALSDMFSNVAFGFVTDGKYLSRSFFCSLCFAVNSIVLLVLVFTYSFLPTFICVILCGMSIGAACPLFPGIIRDYMEEDKHTMGIASIGIFFVPLNFCTSPLIGYFRDQQGSYSGLVYCLAGVSIFCCFLFLSLPKVFLWKNNHLKKEQDKYKMDLSSL